MKKKIRWLVGIMSMILLALTMPLCLTSCGDDDDDNSGSSPMSDAEMLNKMKNEMKGYYYVAIVDDAFNRNFNVDLSSPGKIIIAHEYTKAYCEEMEIDMNHIYNGVSGTLGIKFESVDSKGYRRYQVFCDQFRIDRLKAVYNEKDGEMWLDYRTTTMTKCKEFTTTDLPFVSSIKKVVGQWQEGGEYLDLTPVNGDYLWLSNTSFVESSGHYFSVAGGSNIHVTGVSMGTILGRDAKDKYHFAIVPINDNKMQFTINEGSPHVYTRMSNYVTIE